MHTAGSSINSAFFVKFSKFCLDVFQCCNVKSTEISYFKPCWINTAGTSEISDWNGDITIFWPIEVNGRNFSGFFLLKNLQISRRSQHPFWKLVYGLKVLCVGICYQIILKCNWVRNQRKLQFCLTTPFLSISNFWYVRKTGLNQVKLVFSIGNFLPS